MHATDPHRTVESFQITVIGCSGTYSSGESACSAYLVETPTTAVLLDAGAGCSIELQRQIDLLNLDAIVVSHEHPDHWTELPTLYHAFRWGLGRAHVPLFGTAGTRALLDGACPEALMYTFDWTSIDAGSSLRIGDIDFSFSETDHPVETLAIVAEHGGRSIGYSADTGPGWSPASFDRPIDVFVYEATLTEALEDRGIPHVSGREAAVRAADAGVGHLVLTHVPPGDDPEVRVGDARAHFSGQISVARPGAVFSPTSSAVA